MSELKTAVDEIFDIVKRSGSAEGASDRALRDIMPHVRSICQMGSVARLGAISRLYLLEDAFIQMNVTAMLMLGDPEDAPLDRAIFEAVVRMLSESKHRANWRCLTELVHVFERGVDRPILIRALKTAWRKADGNLKHDLAYDLRRRGLRQVFGIWTPEIPVSMVGFGCSVLVGAAVLLVTPDTHGVLNMTPRQAISTVGWIGILKVVGPALLAFAAAAWFGARWYRQQRPLRGLDKLAFLLKQGGSPPHERKD